MDQTRVWVKDEKINAEIGRLMAKARDLHYEIEAELSVLDKVLQIGSATEVGNRAHYISTRVQLLLYIAAKIDALLEVEYL